MLTGRIKNLLNTEKLQGHCMGQNSYERLVGHSSRGTWVDSAPNSAGKLVLY